MRADYIETIVKNMNELPYRAILFDGTWGIGKSYAINKALEKKRNVCKVSMFGLNSANQIYHEVLFQLALRNSVGGKIGKIADNVVEGLSTVWEKAEQAKDVFYTIAKERELFLLLSKGFRTLHIVVIDDIERMSDKINLEEVFGIVEELKQCPYVRVILVAHTGEMQGRNRELFDKYNEKVVDRIYHITEMPEQVNWGELKIHAGFITGFLAKYKVKNLRTLEKAQKFFDDVKSFCGDIKNEQFINEIRLICFAIVVESTDGLFVRKPEEVENDPLKRSTLEIYNAIEHRIVNYLREIMSGRNLMEMLLHYYQNNAEININELHAEYKLFLEAGRKKNYYRTDKEIKEILPNLRDRMNEAENLAELNKFADEYIVWSDILGEENHSVLNEYRNNLQTMLQELVKSGDDQIFDYGVTLFHLSSEKIKRLYSEEIENMRKEMVEICIKFLQKTTRGKEAYEYSHKLREYSKSTFYKNFIKESIECLYNRKSFPVDEIDETQYHTCYNIMYVLHEIDGDKFLHYCDELSRECDHMSAHRIDVLVKEIIKGY